MNSDSSNSSSSRGETKGPVLVTGGAGYVGSHAVLALLEAGRDVVVIDDLSTGFERLVDDRARLIVADIADRSTVASVVDDHAIDQVLHFAGSTVVPESVDRPLKYYSNNSCKTRTLVETCIDRGVRHFVFSSSAAVYGQPETVPVPESEPTEPINPYGRTKLIAEWMLEDAASAHRNVEHASLRYFNVAGADPDLRTGQATPETSHLIKVAIQTALGDRDRLEIFGTDYPTDDGSCIRDFIHVTDLADLHVLVLEHLAEGGDSLTLNCGYGRGVSVRRVVDAVKRVSQSDFSVLQAPRRPGDPAEVVADTSRLDRMFDWNPDHDDLDEIIRTALAFERAWREE